MQVSSLSSSSTTTHTMLDHSTKAHGCSLGHDKPLYQKAALPKTKGTLTNGTLLLLKCLAAFCMLGNVTASDGTLWSPVSPKMTNQQHIQQLDQAMLVGHRLGLGFGLGLGLGSELFQRGLVFSSSVASSNPRYTLTLYNPNPLAPTLTLTVTSACGQCTLYTLTP
jgi:hypothetical protein